MEGKTSVARTKKNQKYFIFLHCENCFFFCQTAAFHVFVCKDILKNFLFAENEGFAKPRHKTMTIGQLGIVLERLEHEDSGC